MTTSIIDPAVAERAAAMTEVADLAARVALYEQAASAVERKIAQIRADELQPIASELATLRQSLDRAKTRVAVADYMALAPTEEMRLQLFQTLRSEALTLYRRALGSAGAPRELIEREWVGVVHPCNTAKLSIGSMQANGTLLSQTEWEAVYYWRFLALAKRMADLAALSLEERLRLAA